jgi:hypothetical protein
LLFSFLSWVKSDDIEANDFESESNQAIEEKEHMLSFQVNNYISNANLRRILSVLPNPRDLDARATGSVEVFNVESDIANVKVQARMNVDGELDEAWPWWQFCNLL